ncbi:MAG: T9SS type A sorting domain-containing protein [Bacteroidia bacterium]
MNQSKTNLQIACIIAVCAANMAGAVFAQSLQRQSIGSGGNYMFSDGALIQQTVGQPYSTQTLYEDNIAYRPGFQQPIFKVNLIRSNISMDVFPNPATSWVTLKSSKTLLNVKLQVFDITGKLIVDQRMDEFKSYTINCQEWGNGMYVIALADDAKNSYSSKLIILK